MLTYDTCIPLTFNGCMRITFVQHLSEMSPSARSGPVPGEGPVTYNGRLAGPEPGEANTFSQHDQRRSTVHIVRVSSRLLSVYCPTPGARKT